MSSAPGSRGDGTVSLSIVVCTRDRYALLRGCIGAIERQSLDAEKFELIVVDNSSDRVAQAAFLKNLVVDCRCDYAVEDRPGLSRARNIGTGLARGEIVAFLDDDALADPGWAEAILARFAARPGMGVLGGPVEPIWPAARPDWMPPGLDGFLTILDHGAEPHVLRAHEWLVGANLAFRKSALLAAGGFPETLGRAGEALLSNEDLAVVHRMVEAGLEAFYEPNMRVRHHVHAERLTQAWLRRRMGWQAVSDLMTPGRTKGEPGPHRRALHDFLGRPGMPDASALLADQPDAENFSRQLAAIRALLSLLLDAPREAGAD